MPTPLTEPLTGVEMKQFIVITTINAKSRAILEFEKRKDWHIVVVCDAKSQPIPASENLTFLTVEEQLKLDYRYGARCPFNHYARKNIGYYLPRGHFCPINSQNTFWRWEVFPYLYLPATVSFRFTDILRGYIAQGLMGQQGFHIGFTNATVYQERNPHNLMKDFTDETDGYIHIKRIVEIIENLELSDDLAGNMRRVYGELYKSSLVGAEELTYLNLWWEDYKRLV